MEPFARFLNRAIEFAVGVKAADRARMIIKEVETHNAQSHVIRNRSASCGFECPYCSSKRVVDGPVVSEGIIFPFDETYCYYYRCGDCGNMWRKNGFDYGKDEHEELEGRHIKKVGSEYRYMFFCYDILLGLTALIVCGLAVFVLLYR